VISRLPRGKAVPDKAFFGHVIDGIEVESLDGARFETVDPWTREPWAEVALGGQADTHRAVAAARNAFDDGRCRELFTEPKAVIMQISSE
jgi:acyl-CoA reductase-like NAD-dependent aldehyde dehydrogenase